MDKKALQEFVENNPKLVSMKPAGSGIYVLKYKKTVFYKNSWNEFLEECRGTIVDADFNVVSRPFTKIYNHGIEAKAPVLDPATLVTAFRKVNGFMVAVTLHNGQLLVSTTGSTDSDYVKMALELIDQEQYLRVCQQYPDLTFMFECCHQNDPHIIPEAEGMYLLGWRKNTWDSVTIPDPTGLGLFAAQFGTHLVESMVVPLHKLVELTKTARHEGYVYYTADGVSAKIKSPFYLTSKWVARNPKTDKLVDLNQDIKKNIDEEYHGLVDKIRTNIVEYTAMSEQERLAWVRNQMEMILED